MSYETGFMRCTLSDTWGVVKIHASGHRNNTSIHRGNRQRGRAVCQSVVAFQRLGMSATVTEAFSISFVSLHPLPKRWWNQKIKHSHQQGIMWDKKFLKKIHHCVAFKKASSIISIVYFAPYLLFGFLFMKFHPLISSLCHLLCHSEGWKF